MYDNYCSYDVSEGLVNYTLYMYMYACISMLLVEHCKRFKKLFKPG